MLLVALSELPLVSLVRQSALLVRLPQRHSGALMLMTGRPMASFVRPVLGSGARMAGATSANNANVLPL
jgi:hypothetical protein